MKINIEMNYINLGLGEEWLESRNFYRKHRYKEYALNKMKKNYNFDK